MPTSDDGTTLQRKGGESFEISMGGPGCRRSVKPLALKADKRKPVVARRVTAPSSALVSLTGGEQASETKATAPRQVLSSSALKKISGGVNTNSGAKARPNSAGSPTKPSPKKAPAVADKGRTARGANGNRKSSPTPNEELWLSRSHSAVANPPEAALSLGTSSTQPQAPTEQPAAGSTRPSLEAQRANAGGESDDDSGADVDDTNWEYAPPPDNQRTFVFEEDQLIFLSEFDSGNLIQMERTGYMKYNAYVCPDCGNTPFQTNNKQWFHFSIRGGCRGQSVTITIVSLIHSKMYTFGWTPCIAVVPQRPVYTRMNTKVMIQKLDGPLQTPGFPLLMPKPVSAPPKASPAPEGGDLTSVVSPYEGGSTSSALASPITTGPAKEKKGTTYCNMTFEVRFDYDTPVDATMPSTSSAGVLGSAPNAIPAVYIASNHPYSYQRLQRHLASWEANANASSANAVSERRPDGAAIYYHREILCHSLDGRIVDLVTITGTNGMETQKREPSPHPDVPSSQGTIPRAHLFPDKQYVFLSARVHPGEAPASHIMHGCIDLLVNPTDPRAIGLRKNFVFVIVPMINPDGVARGHSRADTTGQNLNRMYRNPSPKKHPAIFAIKELQLALHATGRLALFIDMHAHANKRGAFFYGNAMKGPDQVQNLLYSKLVSLNTPHFDFPLSNFSEQNMFAVGKNGEGKDSSSRVTMFQQCGLVHSYTLESSYVSGITQNAVTALPNVPGEDVDVLPGTPSPKYNHNTMADLGRGLLVALLDMKNCNPCSRLPATPFTNLRGVTTWVQRALLIDTWEQVRRQLVLKSGQSLARATGGANRDTFAGITATSADCPPSMDPKDIPNPITTKPNKYFPPTTTYDMHELASMVGIAGAHTATASDAGAANTSSGAAGATKKKASSAGSAGSTASGGSKHMFVAGAGARAVAAATRDGAILKKPERNRLVPKKRV